MYKIMQTTVLSMLVLTGCANSPESNWEVKKEMDDQKAEVAQQAIDEAPDWYIDPPKGDYGLYGVGTAYSNDMQFAFEKAKLQAMAQIAESYGQRVSQLKKSFKSETNSSNSALTGADTQVIDMLVDQADLSGSEVKNRKVVQEKTGYRSYILAFYPLGETNLIKAERQLEEIQKSAKSEAATAHSELMERTGQIVKTE